MHEDMIAAISGRQSAVPTLLDQMDVPENRKDGTNISNVRWLNRNLAANNSSHPMFQTTRDLIIWLMRNMKCHDQ